MLFAAERCLLGYAGGFLVAGEGVVHKLLVRLFRKRAYYRDYHQTGQHRYGAAVDRRLHDRREAGTDKHVQDHQHAAEDEAHPAGRLGHLLAVQRIQERGQERAGKRAPGHAHQLGYEGYGALVLHQRKHRGDRNEHHDQDPHKQDLLFFAHVLDENSEYKKNGETTIAGRAVQIYDRDTETSNERYWVDKTIGITLKHVEYADSSKTQISSQTLEVTSFVTGSSVVPPSYK